MRLLELKHLPESLTLAHRRCSSRHTFEDSFSDRDQDEETFWKPPAVLEKEFKRISVYSDSKVILTSAARTKFGRVLFKKRLCKRQRFLVQGDILSFLRKNSYCRVTRVLT